MPTGDYLDEAIGGAELKAGAADEKKNSLAIARDRQASVSGSMVHEGAPTEEELGTLRRTSHKIPLSILTIAFIELCERFSYYGTTVVCKSISTTALGTLPMNAKLIWTNSHKLHSATPSRRQ